MVRGTSRDIDEVANLVERFDNRDSIVQKITVVKVPPGQDVTQLAATIEDIINASEEEDAARTGRRARQISIRPDEYTKTLIVAGDQSQFGLVNSLVDQLAAIEDGGIVTQVIQLTNVSARDVQELVDELQQRRSSSSSRSGSGTTRRRVPSQPTSGSSRSGRRGDAIWPQMREMRDLPWHSPYVSAVVLQPGVGAALVEHWLGDDEDDPPPAESSEEPERPRVAFGRRAAEPAAEEPTTASQPGAVKTPALAGVTGELRGDVIVTPVDSDKVIVQGYASDVNFIMQILRMMEATKSPPVIEVFTLANAKATALAPIIEEAIKAQNDVRGADEEFSIAAEGRSNSLIVAASEQMADQIAALIEQLDVEKLPAGAEPRVVALRYVRARDAVSLLEPALQELWRIQEIPKESQPSISAVDRSNSVLIVGTLKDVSDIEKLIRTIDIEITPEDEQMSFVYADVILIQLKNGKAEDVAKVLTDMIDEQQENARQAASGKGDKPFVKVMRIKLPDGRTLPELDLERPIRILPEEGTNSLIVFSTPKNNEALTEIVQVFDTLPIGAETELRAIALQYASAEDVAKLLEEVFKDKSPLMRPSEGDSSSFKDGVLPPVPPGVTGKGLPYNVVVQYDVRSNTVVVIGRKDAVLLASGLIAEVDKPTADLGVRPHVIELKNDQATTLAEKLTDVLEQRAKALGVDKNAARDSAVVIPYDRSNKLVVFAADDVFEMVEELTMDLDAGDPYRQVTTCFRRLGYADAQKLKGLLEELFDRKQTAEKEQSKELKDSLSVFADTRSNSLVMVGTRDYLTEADAMIDNLDQQFSPTVVFALRPIKLNSAQNIAVLLQDMVDKALKLQDSKLEGTPIHISADPLSDTLLLAASQEDIQMLERWVEILDRPSEIDRMTRIVPMSRGSAEDAAKVASDIFKNAGGKDVDVTVTSDPSTNSVVAFGPPAILDDIADFVRQLNDTETKSGTIVRIFKLDQADAEDAGDLLTNILEGKGGSVGGGSNSSRSSDDVAKQVMLMFQHEDPTMGLETLKAMRQDIVVISDLRTNSLVITAPADSMMLMESLVHAIDVPPDAAKIRVFALRNADAQDTVDMLTELFEQKTASNSRSSSDQTTRELTLGEGAGGRQEVSFTTDVRTNSVIAAGTPGYLDLVEDLVLNLDSQPIDDRKTFVYQPRNMQVADMVTALKDYSEQERSLLDELGDEISLSRRQEREIIAIAHEESNAMILGVSPRMEPDLLDIIRELDQPPPQVSIEVLIVEVSMGNDLELGVEFAFQDLQYVKAGEADTTTFDFVGGTDVGAAGAGLGGFTFTITGRDFNFLIHTLQSENSLNVLSRPHIVAMDNQPASIEITDSVPYVSGTTVTTGGISQTNVSRQDVGIKLEVTPQINPDGFVRMEIRQEVSDISDSTIAIGQGLTAPIFNQRVAETVVTVQDNETVVLGGLIQSRDSSTEQKVPIMGDLPLLGPLFRFTSTTQRRSELLVIMTPRVVRTIEDYRELSVEARDYTGIMPGDVKTNPLMRGLQVHPEDLIPADSEDVLGPFDEMNAEPDDGQRGGKQEEYGPLPPISMRPSKLEGLGDPNSYEIPLGMLAQRMKRE